MRNVVAWSGGYDSTLVLYMLGKKSSAEEKVEAVTILSDQLCKEQAKMERLARQRYLKWADRQGHHIVWKEITIKNWGVRGGGCAQGTMWLTLLAPTLKSGDRLNFGYVMKDEFWSCKQLLEKAIDSIMALRYIDDYAVHYPIGDLYKYEVLDRIKQAKIPKNCMWCCEDPKLNAVKTDYVPCKKCTSCITLHMAEEERKYRRKVHGSPAGEITQAYHEAEKAKRKKK